MTITTPVDIKDYLDHYIVGQEKTKKILSTALFNHLTCMKKKLSSHENTMIVGPTGSGKSYLAKKLADFAGLPCVSIDSTAIAQRGWKGLNINEVFSFLYNLKGNSEYGVLIFDEFDKLMRPNRNNHGENISVLTQSSLLSILDGTPLQDKDNLFLTDRIFYIFTGAFEDIFKAPEDTSSPIGFIPSGEPSPASRRKQAEDFDPNAFRRQMIDYGCLPELAGRISNIVKIDTLTKDQLYSAVMSVDNSPVSYYEKLFRIWGKRLVIDPAYVKDLCARAQEDALGVRGARNMLSEELRVLFYHSFETGDDIVYLGHKRHKKALLKPAVSLVSLEEEP